MPMEILDLRLLVPEDLRALLEEEKAAWRETLRWDYSATEAMVLRFLEARALTGYAALEAGRAVGYSFYVLENFKGLIGDAFLSARFRDGSTEVLLMSHVLETLQATPGIRRIEAQLIHLDAPSLRQHFLSQGFQGYDRQFLFLSLPEVPWVPAPSDGAIRILPWEPRWFQPAAELMLAAYRGHVDSEISDQYQSHAGAVRFLENIIRFPGCGVFLPEASLVAFSDAGGVRNGLCGMMLTSVVSERVAHITQLCVSPELQGRGFGRRLILHAVQILREKGFQGATLTVTVSNTRAVELYRGLGFFPLNAFPAFAWNALARQPQLRQRRTAIRP